MNTLYPNHFSGHADYISESKGLPPKHRARRELTIELVVHNGTVIQCVGLYPQRDGGTAMNTRRIGLLMAFIWIGALAAGALHSAASQLRTLSREQDTRPPNSPSPSPNGPNAPGPQNPDKPNAPRKPNNPPSGPNDSNPPSGSNNPNPPSGPNNPNPPSGSNNPSPPSGPSNPSPPSGPYNPTPPSGRNNPNPPTGGGPGGRTR